MNLIWSRAVIATLLTVPFAIYGCRDEAKERRQILDGLLRTEVAAISPALAIVSANTSHMKEIQCFVEGAFMRPSDGKGVCGILSQADAHTRSIAESVIGGGPEVMGGFLFYSWRGRDVTAGWEESQPLGLFISDKGDEPIGLFENREVCLQAEDIFRKLNYSTRPCRPWRDERHSMEAECALGMWPYKGLSACGRKR